MRIDVKEEDGAYVVHAEIPGVKKEDIPEPPFFFLWLRA
jgi:HSP20 family molecular chaperone IbpA